MYIYLLVTEFTRNTFKYNNIFRHIRLTIFDIQK
jgi:hypothetical protein